MKENRKNSQCSDVSVCIFESVHESQDSLFSSSSGWTNYTGIFNLSILLLIISNGRVALENLMKYGILISPINLFEEFLKSLPTHLPNFAIVLLSNLTILSAFLLELTLSKKWLSNLTGGILYSILLTLHLTVPAIVIIRVQSNPFISCPILSIIAIQALKLFSYSQKNEDEFFKSKLLYPSNLSLHNLYYFMFAPTLCYELKFPKTPARRKSFIVKRIAEIILFSFVIVALCQQWMMPLVKNSLAPFSKMDFKRIIERLLKLALPNHLIWLMFFYVYFHSLLNLIAEILCFADRKFYLDFWNSESVSEFWRNWNIPVHRWALRHVYKPAIRNGFSKFTASLFVFLVSAFFHEYLVSVPLNMFRLWAFYGMLAQVPLSFFTNCTLKGGRAGNIVMWLSLILGQPMAILMYVHDWYVFNYPYGALITDEQK